MSWTWRKRSRRPSLRWVRFMIVQTQVLPTRSPSLCLTRTLPPHKSSPGDVFTSFLFCTTCQPSIHGFQTPTASDLTGSACKDNIPIPSISFLYWFSEYLCFNPFSMGFFFVLFCVVRHVVLFDVFTLQDVLHTSNQFHSMSSHVVFKSSLTQLNFHTIVQSNI